MEARVVAVFNAVFCCGSWIAPGVFLRLSALAAAAIWYWRFCLLALQLAFLLPFMADPVESVVEVAPSRSAAAAVFCFLGGFRNLSISTKFNWLT